MKTRTIIGLILALVLLNIPVQWLHVRFDLTEDHRYSLSAPTRALLGSLSEPVSVSILLDGPMNASFARLRSEAIQTVEEMSQYGSIRVLRSDTEALKQGLTPTVIHERAKDGQTVQTRLYPYAVLRMADRQAVVPLLVNQRGLSGEENIQRSVEQLEFAFAQALSTIQRTEAPAIAFLEGHGELPEEQVVDVEQHLTPFFRVDRGSLSGADGELDGYSAVVIADPQTPFSERDKYLLDQYVMRGGRLLWLVNGVRFSDDYLASEGKTPIIPIDLSLQDLLFRYGVRIEPALLQDVQCLPVPVNVSQTSEPNFQPLPWTFSPLLLASDASPITARLGQVSAPFCSPISVVGTGDTTQTIQRHVLLTTSSRTAIQGAPAEVDLSELNPDMQRFAYHHVPVAVELTGSFPSLFAHQMLPEGVTQAQPKRTSSEPTRQIVVGAGSVIRNEWYRDQPLPCGFDRYTQMQFANRDFLINCLLSLAGDDTLIALRQKSMTLRLINDSKARADRTLIQLSTTLLPLMLLGLVALIYIPVRKHKYQKAI